MRTFRITTLIVLTIFMVACTDIPSPIPAAVPSIPLISMEIGDSLPVDCPGRAIVAESTLYCNALPVTHTPIPTGTPDGAGGTVPPVTNTATVTQLPIVTNTPTVTPTATSTTTPLPTNTPTATSQGGGSGVAIAPYADAPLCPTHDPDYWHGLWDAVRGCHYDHEHGANPNGGLIAGYPISGTNLVMDSLRSLQGGIDLGYAWQTAQENTLKHQGYKGQSAIDMPCEQQNYLYMAASKRDCVRAFSVVFHHDTGFREGYGRFHSASVYAQVCGRDGSWCGDIFTGGLSDTGDLHAKYKTTCQDVPGSNRPPCPPADVWEYQRHNPGYWAYNNLEEANNLFASGDLSFSVDSRNFPSNRIGWSNYSSDRTPAIGNREGAANLIFHINARDYRESSYYDEVAKTFKYFCPKSDCVATSSAVYIYALALQLPKGLPVGADGFINYSGYTDRAGRLETSCTVPGVECVPFRVRHVKPTPGLFIYDMTPGFIPGVRTWGDGVITDGVRYFDTTPSGVRCSFDNSKRCSWITLPTELGQ